MDLTAFTSNNQININSIDGKIEINNSNPNTPNNGFKKLLFNAFISILVAFIALIPFFFTKLVGKKAASNVDQFIGHWKHEQGLSFITISKDINGKVTFDNIIDFLGNELIVQNCSFSQEKNQLIVKGKTSNKNYIIVMIFNSPRGGILNYSWERLGKNHRSKSGTLTKV